MNQTIDPVVFANEALARAEGPQAGPWIRVSAASAADVPVLARLVLDLAAENETRREALGERGYVLYDLTSDGPVVTFHEPSAEGHASYIDILERLNEADAALAAAQKENETLRKERDEAIAHDRQPYPTPWAYEQVCRTLAAARADTEKLKEALTTADDLLRRLAEWDVLVGKVGGKPLTADGPYWQAEIDRLREALRAIASCESVIEGDVVSIARATLLDYTQKEEV